MFSLISSGSLGLGLCSSVSQSASQVAQWHIHVGYRRSAYMRGLMYFKDVGIFNILCDFTNEKI